MFSLPAPHSKRFITLCGRIFRDADCRYFPQARYRGRTIIFCTDSCLGAFEADPENFYRAHRNSDHRPAEHSQSDLTR